MVKTEELTRDDLPITIKHKINEITDVGGIKQLDCLYCNERFFRNRNDIVLNRQIKCPHCGKVHINTSNKKFKLRKFTNKDILDVPNYS